MLVARGHIRDGTILAKNMFGAGRTPVIRVNMVCHRSGIRTRTQKTGGPERPVFAPVPSPTHHPVGAPPPAAYLAGLLQTAAFNGDTNMIRILLDMGTVDIDSSDSTGRTALHLALEGPRTNACTLLVERGANVFCKASGGITPLDVAVGKGVGGGHSTFD